jgi:hypothetical protein
MSHLHYVGVYPIPDDTKQAYCFLIQQLAPLSAGRCPYGFDTPSVSQAESIPKEAARILLSHELITEDINSKKPFVVMIDLSSLPSLLVVVDHQPTTIDPELRQAFEQSTPLRIPIVYTNTHRGTCVLQIL